MSIGAPGWGRGGRRARGRRARPGPTAPRCPTPGGGAVPGTQAACKVRGSGGAGARFPVHPPAGCEGSGHAERELHLWTNLARLDPPSLRDDLSCWERSFTPALRSPRAPLAWHPDLAAAARFHSADMSRADRGGTGRALSHDSTDGTRMDARVGRFYQGPLQALGENVAFGYPTAYEAVLAWLCSNQGHRENLLEPMFDTLGTGHADRYWTQDFARTGRGPRALNMGVHVPETPTSTVELLVDVWGEWASEVTAWLDGEPVPMALLAGAEAAGVYHAEVPVEGEGCHGYWFTARVDGDRVRWPEEGAYAWGPCDATDSRAGWLDAEAVAAAWPAATGDGGDDDDDGDRRERGCSTAGAPGVAWAAALLLAARRRRQA